MKKANAKRKKRMRDLTNFEGIEELSKVLSYNDEGLDEGNGEEPRVLSLTKGASFFLFFLI